jgi:hypothetical protein
VADEQAVTFLREQVADVFRRLDVIVARAQAMGLSDSEIRREAEHVIEHFEEKHRG